MKGNLTVLQTMYDFIVASPLKGAVSGDVYKGERPLNSNLEDVCVNMLPLSAGQLQKCVVNVNVFVPDITLSNEAGEETVADYARLQQLESVALDALEQHLTYGYSFYVQQSTVFKDQESKSHFINIRIEYYSPNLN